MKTPAWIVGVDAQGLGIAQESVDAKRLALAIAGAFDKWPFVVAIEVWKRPSYGKPLEPVDWVERKAAGRGDPR